MTAFAERYRQAFTALGRPLRRADGVPRRELHAAERRLGVWVPAALREYYRVAGEANDFNCAYNWFVSPVDWEVRKGKLVFLVEQQAVYLYGTVVGARPSDGDPPAFIAENNFGEDEADPLRWAKVYRTCSGFLLAMLHIHAGYFGAMPEGVKVEAPAGVRKVLDRNWSFYWRVARGAGL